MGEWRCREHEYWDRVLESTVKGVKIPFYTTFELHLCWTINQSIPFTYS